VFTIGGLFANPQAQVFSSSASGGKQQESHGSEQGTEGERNGRHICWEFNNQCKLPAFGPRIKRDLLEPNSCTCPTIYADRERPRLARSIRTVRAHFAEESVEL